MLRITLIRASTLLLEFDGIRVLTDPWFNRNLAGWPALRRAGVPIDALPAVDLVAVSHFHPDHWSDHCARHLLRNNPAVPFVGPAGSSERFVRAGVAGSEMPAGAQRRIGELLVRSVECSHAQRGPRQVNYLFEYRGVSVYFGGDATWSGSFAAVGREHPVDIALLPVSGTRVCGCKVVMSPGDAVRAATALGARFSIPIHEGGEWLPLPPIVSTPGRATHFAKLSRQDEQAAPAVLVRRGHRATFEGQGEGLEVSALVRAPWAVESRRAVLARAVRRLRTAPA